MYCLLFCDFTYSYDIIRKLSKHWGEVLGVSEPAKSSVGIMVLKIRWMIRHKLSEVFCPIGYNNLLS